MQASSLFQQNIDSQIQQALHKFNNHLDTLNQKNKGYFNALQQHKFNCPKGPAPKINVIFDNVNKIQTTYQQDFPKKEQTENNQVKKQRPQTSNVEAFQKYPNQFKKLNDTNVYFERAPESPKAQKKVELRHHYPFTSVTNNKLNYLNWGSQPTDRIVPPNEFPVLDGLKSNCQTSYKNQFQKNKQTLDHTVIQMIKDQQRGIHKGFNPDGPFNDETTSRSNFAYDKKNVEKCQKYIAQDQIQIKEISSKGQFKSVYSQNYK